MIKAKILKDSIGPSGIRITTYLLAYPRMVHSELMTHRAFSRNASSSRAIPVSKQIQAVVDNPVIPLKFTRNKPGMQGGEALVGDEHDQAVKVWLEARDRAVDAARQLVGLEVHKQYANRIIEPWAYITVVLTSTDFDNFFALRIHTDAQPEICALAKAMYQAREMSVPQELKSGEWHLPFIDESLASYALPNGLYGFDDTLIKRSVARCARVSYLNHEGKESSLEEDLKLYDRLLGQLPIHASPAEHQAMAVDNPDLRSGNFRGWEQYRKVLENENIDLYGGNGHE
jgi:thymidylate synthase ThyX